MGVVIEYYTSMDMSHDLYIVVDPYDLLSGKFDYKALFGKDAYMEFNLNPEKEEYLQGNSVTQSDKDVKKDNVLTKTKEEIKNERDESEKIISGDSLDKTAE